MMRLPPRFLCYTARPLQVIEEFVSQERMIAGEFVPFTPTHIPEAMENFQLFSGQYDPNAE